MLLDLLLLGFELLFEIFDIGLKLYEGIAGFLKVGLGWNGRHRRSMRVSRRVHVFIVCV